MPHDFLANNPCHILKTIYHVKVIPKHNRYKHKSRPHFEIMWP